MKQNSYTYGNAIIVVHRPELTEKEQEKRENRISIALQQFGRAVQDAERAAERGT